MSIEDTIRAIVREELERAFTYERFLQRVTSLGHTPRVYEVRGGSAVTCPQCGFVWQSRHTAWDLLVVEACDRRREAKPDG